MCPYTQGEEIQGKRVTLALRSWVRPDMRKRKTRLMTSQIDYSGDLFRALRALEPGTHVCHCYESELDGAAVLAAYVRAGLDRGERVLIFTGPSRLLGLVETLERKGIDFEAGRAAGRIQIQSFAAFEEGGSRGWSAASVQAFLQELAAAARKDGYDALRLACETTELAESGADALHCREFELGLDAFLTQSGAQALCRYHLSRALPARIVEALSVHAVVVSGGAVHENFYKRPERRSGRAGAKLLLRRLLDNLSRFAPRSAAGAATDLELVRTAMEQIDEALLVVTDDLHPPGPEILYVNPAFTRLTGWTPDEAIGRTVKLIMGPKTDSFTIQHARRELREGRAVSGQTTGYRRDGTDFVMDWHVSPIHDANGRVMRFAAMLREGAMEAPMGPRQRHADRDTLTGLPGKVAFMKRLGRAVERTQRREGSRFAVLVVDVDRLEDVNRTLGERFGDQVLAAVAWRLQAALRPGDLVSRLQSDEFVILLEDVRDARDVQAVTERILDSMTSPFTLAERELRMSVSIGIAFSDSAYSLPEYAIRDAYAALVRARALGRGKYAFYDETPLVSATTRDRLAYDLRQALERSEFLLLYQPEVALNTNRIVGFEALLRWEHPERGLLNPPDFLPVAEELNLIRPIEHWVLLEACRQLRKWQMEFDRTPPLTMSVNLSPTELGYADLPATISEVLTETGIAPGTLRLEFPEDILTAYRSTAHGVLSALNALGLRLCIDAFGRGHASLTQLAEFRVAMVKIHPLALSGVKLEKEGKKVDGQLVENLLALARRYGLDAVAAGVETVGQAEALRDQACLYGQGYLFSSPIDAPSARRLLATEAA